MSTRRTKKVAKGANYSSSSADMNMLIRKDKSTSNDSVYTPISDNIPADLIFSNPNDSCSRSRLWNWLDAKFTKQDSYIKEQSEQIKNMIAESKRSLLTEIEQKFNVLKDQIIKDVKREVKELNDRVAKIETANTEVEKLKSDVENLKIKCLNQENSTVASDVRITGLPFYNNENLQTIFESICSSLNTTLPLVKSIFRVKHYKNYRNVPDPPIVIKFYTPFEKNYFLKTVALHRNKFKSPLRLSDAGFESDTPFYINENLTPHNYGIFKTALKLKKDKILKTVYSLRGIVYVKQNENDEPISIIFPDQLQPFFRTSV